MVAGLALQVAPTGQFEQPTPGKRIGFLGQVARLLREPQVKLFHDAILQHH
jgi:hypothetical protein